LQERSNPPNSHFSLFKLCSLILKKITIFLGSGDCSGSNYVNSSNNNYNNELAGNGGGNAIDNNVSYVNDVVQPSVPVHGCKEQHRDYVNQPAFHHHHHHHHGNQMGNSSGQNQRQRRTQKRVTHNEKRYHSGWFTDWLIDFF
jgi:hypothetical protein